MSFFMFFLSNTAWVVCYTHVFPCSAGCLYAGINRVQLLGRVGRDPEQRGDVHPIITFPLATSQNVRSSTEEES